MRGEGGGRKRGMHDIAHHTIIQAAQKLRNYFECAITTPALCLQTTHGLFYPSPFPPALDKDLDDISCGGQSPGDAIIGGSSDHYARTQDQHYCRRAVVQCSESEDKG